MRRLVMSGGNFVQDWSPEEEVEVLFGIFASLSTCYPSYIEAEVEEKQEKAKRTLN